MDAKNTKQCVILAAGRGSRLSNVGSSKPLLRVAGLSLIERTIVTASEAGLEDFLVVTGYRHKLVEEFLSSITRRRHIRCTSVYNEAWQEKGNGASVLKGAAWVKGGFILLMSDHIFDAQILAKLIQQPLPVDGLVLACDFRTTPPLRIDIDDVTKVAVSDGLVREIGKDLGSYNAFDTGLFHCTSGLFAAIEKSIEMADSSLSGGVRLLAEKKRAKVYDIGDRFWMDIDTPRDRRLAHHQLYRNLAKPHDGWVSRKLNRKLSTRVFTPLLLKLFWQITPNITSLISFSTGLVASVLFFLKHPVAAGLVVHLASVLDGSDGEIARLKKLQSAFGNFFDAVLDRFADTFILAGMSYFVLTAPPLGKLLGVAAIPLCIAASIFSISGNVMVSYTSAKSVADFGYKYGGELIAAGKGRDLRMFVLFIGGLFSFLHPVSVLVALFFVAIISNIIVVRRIILSRSYANEQIRLLSPKLKAIVFDFDGTLVDSMPGLTAIATKLLVTQYAFEPELALEKYHETSGLDFKSQMEIICPGNSQNQEVVREFETQKARTYQKIELFPESLAVLRSFRDQDFRCFVCSSTSDKQVQQYCLRHGITELIDGCYGLCSDRSKKELLGSILEDRNFHPEEVLFVGDSLHDGEIAYDVGTYFIGVHRILPEESFSQRGFVSVEHLSALLGLLKRSNRFHSLLAFIS